jgi:hypothetical protein
MDTPFHEHHERLREFVRNTPRLINGRKLGLLPSKYDPAALRSHLLYAAPNPATLPQETFNRLRVPDRGSKFNQGTFGDCYDAAFNWGPLGMNAVDQGIFPPGGFSEYFGVSCIKNMDGNPDQEGSDIGTTMQSGVQYGCVPDALMPTSSMTKDYALPMPSAALIAAAAKYKIKNKVQIMSATDTNRTALITQMMQALAAGFVPEMGIIVCENFETITGPQYLVPLPAGSFLGGHALRIVDYKVLANGRVQFLIFNTWGNTWALAGEGWFDEAWFTAQFDMTGAGDMAYYVTEAFQALDVLPAVLPKRTIAMTIGASTALVNGQGAPLQAAPFIQGSTAMGPVDFIADNLGATAVQSGGTITIIGTTKIVLAVGSNLAIVNGIDNAMTLPVALSGNVVVAPIRSLAGLLKTNVDWEQDEDEVVLTA